MKKLADLTAEHWHLQVVEKNIWQLINKQDNTQKISVNYQSGQLALTLAANYNDNTLECFKEAARCYQQTLSAKDASTKEYTLTVNDQEEAKKIIAALGETPIIKHLRYFDPQNPRGYRNADAQDLKDLYAGFESSAPAPKAAGPEASESATMSKADEAPESVTTSESLSATRESATEDRRRCSPSVK
jgi:hypothetical protein